MTLLLRLVVLMGLCHKGSKEEAKDVAPVTCVILLSLAPRALSLPRSVSDLRYQPWLRSKLLGGVSWRTVVQQHSSFTFRSIWCTTQLGWAALLLLPQPRPQWC